MNPTADLMKLVEDWRESARSAKQYSVTEYEDGYAAAEKACADRLQAALTASCDARVGGSCLQCGDEGRVDSDEGTEPCPRCTAPAQPKASEPDRDGRSQTIGELTDAGFAVTIEPFDEMHPDHPDHPKASEDEAGGEDAKDAARYRWLRENDNSDLLAEDVIDEAIAAMLPATSAKERN